MNTLRKITLLSTLFITTLSACNSSSFALSNKKFTYNKTEATTSNPKFFTENTDFVGKDVKELGEKVASIIGYNNALSFGSTPLTNATYHDKETPSYSVNERKEGEFTTETCRVVSEGNDNYAFVKINFGTSTTLVDYTFSLGNEYGKVNEKTKERSTKCLVSSVKYDSENKSLTTTITINNSIAVDEQMTFDEQGVFALTWTL